MVGQMRSVLLRYFGVNPRILGTVNVDQIKLKFKKFDGFSQNPVTWTPESEKMKNFSSKWGNISNLTAFIVHEDNKEDYFILEFSKNNGYSIVDIPLQLKPAGYTTDDALLASLMLMGRIRGVASSVSTLPPPVVLAEVPPLIVPTATPTVAATAPTSTDLPETPIEPLSTPISQPTLIPEPKKEKTTTRIKLELLKSLYDDGLISDEVYQEKMRSIMKDF